MKTIALLARPLALLLLTFAAAQGANIVVNSTADPAGFNPNITIAQLGATVTLRDAVNAANNTAGDDEITFAPGLAGQTLFLSQVGASTPITGPNDTMLSALSITSTVTMRGPAGGVTIARDPSVNRLRLILIAGNGNLTVDGLTLADGVERTGGAIQNHGTLTVRASTVRNCLVNAFTLLPGYARGGGIYNTGTLTVIDSTFSNNTAVITGGGIYSATGAPLTVTNSLFNGCVAYISGGAIASLDSGGLSTVSGSTFIGNRVLGASGGVDQNDGFGGGAIKNRGVLAVSSSTFDNNVVDNGYNGGAINSSGTLNLARSTLVRNVSNHTNIQAFGGGLENLGQATVTNCTFTQNFAKFGTAVSSRNGSTITLNHCTVVAQQVTPEIGAAVELYGTATITNSIICRNYYFSTFYNSNQPLNVYGSFSGSNNVINNETPGVGDLGNFGGPTQTMPLQFGSPALDAGIATAGVTTDQRGVARPQGPAVDIGAFESGGPPVITSANAATFIATTTNRFQVTASGLPAPTFSASGTLPPGVSLTSSGLLSGSPPAGSLGTYPFTITALNSLGQSSTQQFVLTVSATELIVTTAVDEDNGSTDPALGTGTSLREAFNRAMQMGGSPTIYFASALAGQTIQGTMGINYGDGPTAFRVITSVTIQGLTGDNGITLARSIAGDLRGFQVSSGTLTLNDLTLANWRAGYGAAILNFTSVRLNRCTVRNNSGEGIIRSGGFADGTFENCTLANNEGGYAIQGNGFQTLRHTTITGNTGGGISPSANPNTATNSIIAGNTAGGSPADIPAGGRMTNSANNLIGTGGSGFLVNGVNGNIVGVPANQLLFGPLASNGGPTQTVALLPGSPAINNAAILLSIDQRGVTRPQRGAPDIGAFELEPFASAPIIAPAGGVHENSVAVALVTSSVGATIRYTLDGSTPSETHGTIYSGAFNLTDSATVRAIAVGGEWLPSIVSSANFTVLTPLPFWRMIHGLPADGSQDLANPSGDGIANLLKFAFNMAPTAGDLALANVQVLPENGTAGLPAFDIDEQGRLVVQFIRRKAATHPGISYVVETGPEVGSLSPLSLSGALVESLDTVWERVTVVDPAITPNRFGRVRVARLGSYFNDFNTGLGAATLRGSAVWTGSAVKLTDENTGGFGAVVFDHVTAGPELRGFTARFNLALGPISFGIPADGANFAVGDLGAGPWGEGGPGTAHHLAVGFDTYNNVGVNGPADIGIHVWVNGTHIALNATNPYTNGTSVPVEITYDAVTGLTVKFNGATIFNQLPVPGFSLQAGDRFGLSARTGGFAERAVVDDVVIMPR